MLCMLIYSASVSIVYRIRHSEWITPSAISPNHTPATLNGHNIIWFHKPWQISISPAYIGEQCRKAAMIQSHISCRMGKKQGSRCQLINMDEDQSWWTAWMEEFNSIYSICRWSNMFIHWNNFYADALSTIRHAWVYPETNKLFIAYIRLEKLIID